MYGSNFVVRRTFVEVADDTPERMDEDSMCDGVPMARAHSDPALFAQALSPQASPNISGAQDPSPVVEFELLGLSMMSGQDDELPGHSVGAKGPVGSWEGSVILAHACDSVEPDAMDASTWNDATTETDVGDERRPASSVGGGESPPFSVAGSVDRDGDMPQCKEAVYSEGWAGAPNRQRLSGSLQATQDEVVKDVLRLLGVDTQGGLEGQWSQESVAESASAQALSQRPQVDEQQVRPRLPPGTWFDCSGDAGMFAWVVAINADSWCPTPWAFGGEQVDQRTWPDAGGGRRRRRRRPAAADRAPQAAGVCAAEEHEEERTTVMLRNIPNDYTRQMLIDMLEVEGFTCLYDFIYLPIDFKTQACLGYAFINLARSDIASKFWAKFDGYIDWVVLSKKIGKVTWSGPHQGWDAHVGRYRNSPVMHPSVPDRFKPLVFKGGKVVPFPPPLKAPKAPRSRYMVFEGEEQEEVQEEMQEDADARTVEA